VAASSSGIELSFNFLNIILFLFLLFPDILTFVMIINLDKIRVWAIFYITWYVCLCLEARYIAFYNAFGNLHTYSGPNDLCNGYHFRIILLL
jgi:hypothetical protein